MGKTKIKLIDDSVAEVENKTQKAKAKKNAEAVKAEISETQIEEKTETSQVEATQPSAEKKEKKSKSSKKAKKQRSKKYQEILEKSDRNQKLSALEAVKIAQANSYSKFEGTIEAHINTNAKNLRGLLNMPFAKGRKLRILAFGLKKEGLDDIIPGTEETISQIEAGKINFDIVVTTPEWMPKLAKVAKILGPRGLMPNPKNGTISEDLEKTISELQGGKTEYKTEANGQVIHLSVGKISQKPEEIVANLKVIYNTVGRSKIQRISLSPTMGPSTRVDLSTLS